MKKITIDMETRSRVNLKEQGVYVYSERIEDTDILCISVVSGNYKAVWVPDHFKHNIPLGYESDIIDTDTFLSIIDNAEEIHAHNAAFERLLWRHVMVIKYGYPDIPFNKWRCTAAKASFYALPRNLNDACIALGLAGKDNEGKNVMLKMSSPRTPTKSNTNEWHEDPEDFRSLMDYCINDSVIEQNLDESLYPLSAKELEVWRVDQIINDRGLKIDVEAVSDLILKIEYRKDALLNEIKTLTDGIINSPKQIDKTLEWFADQGLMLDDLTKSTVADALKNGTPNEQVRRVLEIRQALSKSSVSKLEAMYRMACSDGRIRGTMLYHGAATGRFSGKGIQPQNYPRKSYDAFGISEILQYSVADIESSKGDTFAEVSKCLRGMIIAGRGKELICADYKSIEARVLAWIAGEENDLSAFRNGLDIYKVAASSIYRIPYDQITPEQRQTGKVAVLALGYQGWVNAFMQMATTYGLKVPETDRLKVIAVLEKEGLPVTESSVFETWAKPIIMAWRKAHPAVTSFWAGMEQAAVRTIETKEPHAYGLIKFGIRDNFLHLRLPSGRILSYYDPSTEQTIDPYDRKKTVIKFWGVNSVSRKWTQQSTYGGKLTENIVQAISRDILVEAILRLEQAGYPVVLHVHDEIVSEINKGTGNLKEYESIMSIVPDWATGCPIEAEGWIGDRYRKA